MNTLSFPWLDSNCKLSLAFCGCWIIAQASSLSPCCTALNLSCKCTIQASAWGLCRVHIHLGNFFPFLGFPFTLHIWPNQSGYFPWFFHPERQSFGILDNSEQPQPELSLGQSYSTLVTRSSLDSPPKSACLCLVSRAFRELWGFVWFGFGFVCLYACLSVCLFVLDMGLYFIIVPNCYLWVSFLKCLLFHMGSRSSFFIYNICT